MGSGIDGRGLELLAEALSRLDAGFAALPEHTDRRLDEDRCAAILDEVAQRMTDNFPYQHPLYAGQMLKPPHPIARLAYTLAMSINPNNHALDGGRASSAMEVEAVAALAGMFGLEQHLGHLTGGGTMANLEALWVASRVTPGGRVLASASAHYTHGRLCEVLGIPFRAIPADASGRMDLDALRQALEEGPTACVVATMGTTGVGAVDPLADILELCAGVRVHCDAAYGGYFRIASALDPGTQRHLEVMSRADSIVVDPHKHGLQPYGCGCVLFADPSVGRHYQHDSPYTYFSSAELHLGEITLECSRPGAAAVALWATQRALPPEPGGALAADLDRSLDAARALAGWIERSEAYQLVLQPELDIVIFHPRGDTATAISTASRRVFERAAEAGLHLALFSMDAAALGVAGGEPATVLRCCLMKPEHLDWIGPITERLSAAGDSE